MKKMTHVTIGVLSVALMASCGGTSSSGQTDTFAPSLDTNTTCSISVVGSYDNFEALEAEFHKFNAYYKNVSLTYSKLDDYNNILSTVLERETDKPNIFFSFASMVGNEKYDSVFGHMENLSDPNLKLNLDCIRPGLLNHDGKGNVTMVPVFSRSYGTLVNKDLFKKENIEIPTSWTGLLNACEQFANKGYKNPMMGYSLKSSSCLMNTIAYPAFVATLAGNPTALELANNLDPAAGEYTRSALEKVKQLVDSKAIDLTECDKIGDNYTKVILRFFEGDVPMMICAGDTVSGTKKRESQSSAYMENRFEYSFYPIPLTEQGGYFIDSPSVEFSVNKDCDNLDMTNEFMRFLITNKELNAMASAKRLVTPTKEMSFDPVYAPFGQVPSERTFSPEVLGIKDRLATQIRVAAHKVGRGELTIDEAVAKYGTFE